MISADQAEKIESQARSITIAQTGDPDLGLLQLLPGTWSNAPDLCGNGWNSIALPFASAGTARDYRLLVNRYNEVLKFTLVDKSVKNRGIQRGNPSLNTDQVVVALDYEQRIEQIDADDFPKSGLQGAPGTVIHHEPGLWLFMVNQTEPHCDLARLGTIPHGDSLLALGRGDQTMAAPVIPVINVLPIGVDQTLTNPYLAPYQHFHANPFLNLFDPTKPHERLINAIPGPVTRTTKLVVSTRVETGGIVNTPFIVRQANAAEMISTFWICELQQKDAEGNPRLIMQYFQIVLLDFFDRKDGLPGPIRWPHVSVNTLEKTAKPDGKKAIESAARIEKKL